MAVKVHGRKRTNNLNSHIGGENHRFLRLIDSWENPCGFSVHLFVGIDFMLEDSLPNRMGVQRPECRRERERGKIPLLHSSGNYFQFIISILPVVYAFRFQFSSTTGHAFYLF